MDTDARHQDGNRVTISTTDEPRSCEGYGAFSVSSCFRSSLLRRVSRRNASIWLANEPMLRITGGKVYDPANGVDGVVKDIYVSPMARSSHNADPADGRRTIDARGMFVFPGGVDVHSHVAGAALNFARRPHAGKLSPGLAFPAHAWSVAPASGHHSDDLRDRLLLRGNGLDHGQRGGRSDPRRPDTLTKSCTTRPIVGQVVPRADGQQRDCDGPARSRRRLSVRSTSSPG